MLNTSRNSIEEQHATFIGRGKGSTMPPSDKEGTDRTVPPTC
jgi:hypothetical protein